MEKRQIKSWITIKHHHIPIFEGENTQDAINRFKEGVRKGKQTAPISSKQYIKKRDAAEKAVNALEQHQKRVDSANERIKTDTSADAQKEKLNADRTFKEAMQRYSTRQQAFDAIKDKKQIKSYEFRKKQVDKELSEKQDQISRTSQISEQMNNDKQTFNGREYTKSNYYIFKDGQLYRNVTAGQFPENKRPYRVAGDYNLYVDSFTGAALPYSNYYVANKKTGEVYKYEARSYGTEREYISGLVEELKNKSKTESPKPQEPEYDSTFKSWLDYEGGDVRSAIQDMFENYIGDTWQHGNRKYDIHRENGSLLRIVKKATPEDPYVEVIADVSVSPAGKDGPIKQMTLKDPVTNEPMKFRFQMYKHKETPEPKKKYDDYDKKAVDTLIVQGPDGKMHLERYRGQDLDNYPHFAEVNHDKLVDIKSNGGKWNEAAMNGIAIKDIYDYLGKEFNFNDGKPLEIKTEPPKPKEPEYERTPKMDWIEKRIEGKQTELDKLEKKMERINKAKESDYKENNPYYYSDYDFRSTTKDIERAKADIEKYKQDMETEISKAKSRNVPVITEFLNDWEQKSIEYFTKEEQVYRKKHQEEYVPQMKKYSAWLNDHSGFRWGTDEEKAKYKAMYKEEDEYSKNFKNYWKFVTQFYDGSGTWEENMRKAVAREKVAKYDDIITRTNDLIGQITDAGGLHIGKKGDLNGVIIGSKGKATVETIGAGGYNIQRYHFRTLIHELKEKK